tara:strand:+ start:55 stop:327 length:273 start_codon:yes stop_codon:yes gene_type:complete
MQSQLSTQVLPINNSYEAEFPVEKNEVQSNIAAYKKLSKEENTDAVTAVLAVMLKEMPPVKAAEKYVALIVSKFNTEQLQAFSNAHKGVE